MSVASASDDSNEEVDMLGAGSVARVLDAAADTAAARNAGTDDMADCGDDVLVDREDDVTVGLGFGVDVAVAAADELAVDFSAGEAPVVALCVGDPDTAFDNVVVSVAVTVFVGDDDVVFGMDEVVVGCVADCSLSAGAFGGDMVVSGMDDVTVVVVGRVADCSLAAGDCGTSLFITVSLSPDVTLSSTPRTLPVTIVVSVDESWTISPDLSSLLDTSPAFSGVTVDVSVDVSGTDFILSSLPSTSAAFSGATFAVSIDVSGTISLDVTESVVSTSDFTVDCSLITSHFFSSASCADDTSSFSDTVSHPDSSFFAFASSSSVSLLFSLSLVYNISDKT